ncbi:hypothetical protein DL96DRAFT_1612057 [Flagelloscypha sp. PMI_526]|nr:hypothetical protein DL96DRAFT_1612057 [Flagelloscypha sp. PMI_526]
MSRRSTRKSAAIAEASSSKCSVNSMPVEILSLIFQHTVASPFTDFGMRILPSLRLSCVCSLWRSLMLAPYSASLWAEFALDISGLLSVPHEDQKLTSNWHLVQLHLTRSRNSLLTLELYLDDLAIFHQNPMFGYHYLRHTPIMRLLFASRHRWKDITLPTDILFTLHFMQDPALPHDAGFLLPSLRAVRLVDDIKPVDPNTYSWETLLEFGGSIHDFVVPPGETGQWISLTTIEIYTPSVAEIARLPSCCPNVDDLTLNFRQEVEWPIVVNKGEVVTFKNVRTFDVTVHLQDPVLGVQVLDHLAFPALRSLSVHYLAPPFTEDGLQFTPYCLYDPESVISLVERSKCRLEELSYFDLPASFDDRHRFLSALPHLRKLGLSLPGISDRPAPKSVLIPTIEDSAPLLPNLESLGLSGFIGWEYNRLLDMVESRLDDTPLKNLTMCLDKRGLEVLLCQRKPRGYSVIDKVPGDVNGWGEELLRLF